MMRTQSGYRYCFICTCFPFAGLNTTYEYRYNLNTDLRYQYLVNEFKFRWNEDTIHILLKRRKGEGENGLELSILLSLHIIVRKLRKLY